MRKRTYSNYRRIQILYRSASWQKKEVWLDKVSKYAVCGESTSIYSSHFIKIKTGLWEPEGRIFRSVTLFKPGEGHIMPTTLLLTPPPPGFSELPTALQSDMGTNKNSKVFKYISTYLVKAFSNATQNNSKTLYVLDIQVIC